MADTAPSSAAAAPPPSMDVIKFAPLNGALDVSFLTELSRRKLNVLGLNDDAIDIRGSFTRAERQGVASPICLSADAFPPSGNSTAALKPIPVLSSSCCMVPGTLRNANTMEQFMHDWDKKELLKEAGRRIAEDIASGAALAEPERLLRFLLLTFADLKTHKYYYWFAFPAFAITPPPIGTDAVALASVLSSDQLHALAVGYAELGSPGGSNSNDEGRGAAGAALGAGDAAPPPPFFCVRIVGGAKMLPRDEDEFVDVSGPGDAGVGLEVGPLAAFPAWREQAAQRNDGTEVLLAFCDPCPLAGHPGWPMRNLVALASVIAKGMDSVGIIAFREPAPGSADRGASAAAEMRPNAAPPPPSILIRVAVPAAPASFCNVTAGADDTPPIVGWEKNSNGKLGPRLMDLSAQMDPVALAESSVDLNLRLMRWRLMPSLQTERVAATKCLLMGAGTLGCAVARCLIGWGVRHITFVDSGGVSYSNPVRQSLFTFNDCLNGGAPKAQAAADALKSIWPSVVATAHRVAIPMPGHAVGDREREAVKADCDNLDGLVASHDVVFLLTDTRESRWLPSLLAARHGKLCINAALGFDSLMVMRHGMADAASDASSSTDGEHGAAFSSPRLGCYFCNDIVAPANSMLRRTLDQQCTVSRPGLSMIASALAVEMMVTVLHHPEGGRAKADLGGNVTAPDRSESCMGHVPHQLRASLPTYSVNPMVGCAFDRCTACSPIVLRSFASGGFDNFLLPAFNRATYLEDLTGLTQMHKDSEAALENVEAFDESEDDLE